MSTKFQTNKTTSLRATRLFSNLKSNPMYAMEGIHCSSFPGPVFCQLSLLTGKLREVLHFQDLCYWLHSEETMPQPTHMPYKIVKAGRRAVILRKAHLYSSLCRSLIPNILQWSRILGAAIVIYLESKVKYYSLTAAVS